MKKVTALYGLALALAGASSAVAMSPSSHPNLDYTSSLTPAGVLKIAGTETTTGKRFSFRVSNNGYVSGTVDGKSVSFQVAPETRDRAVTAAARRLAAGNEAGPVVAGTR